jgi:alpha-glucosidase
MMYYGEELGMTTTPPTREEEVKDPVGVTGWPQDKGRMQWDDRKKAIQYRTDHLVTCRYGLCQQERQGRTDQSGIASQLGIENSLPCGTDPTLHEGDTIMLDTTNPSALSYVRKGSAGHPSIFVVLNFTAVLKTISLDIQKDHLPRGDVHTHLVTDASLEHQTSLTGITLPATPFGSREPEIEKLLRELMQATVAKPAL